MATMKDKQFKVNPVKMSILKMMVLMDNLSTEKVEELNGCDYEFTIGDDMISMLEVWYNPNGEHNYKDKYRTCFNMKPIPFEMICD